MDRIENLIVVIPAYEPPKEFIEYAKQVSALAKCLVVVNDGSNENFNYVFDEIAKLDNVAYITYPENHGKGYALKKAFKFCEDNFDKTDIVVTADCDGQHRVKDITNVYKATLDNLDALVLGSRDFNKENVPKRSKAGNTNIRRMFKFFYGVKVYDAQTGLRGFSVQTAGIFLGIKGDRFEYEMSMLIYAKKHRIDILETPIDTVYPDDPKDHVSHFKTFSDSAKVVGVVLKNMFALRGLFYIIVSAISAILDFGIYWLLKSYLNVGPTAVNILIATCTARVSSSIVNFILNYKYVFNGVSKKSIYRYYILWLCQLGASYGLAYLFGTVIGWDLTLWGLDVPIYKIVCDLFLAIISYKIQDKWVFKKPRKGFYGPIGRGAKKIMRVFKRKYRCNVIRPNQPTVYVSRHLNMHAQFTTLVWFDFDVHPMSLNVFLDEKLCYRQFADYTFTARKGKKPKKHNFKAWACSRVVPKVVRSLGAIPVYRHSAGALTTFKSSMKYLLNGESIVVYVDVDYTAKQDVVSEIYKGFFRLGEMYKKKTGESLRFVPLYINDKDRTINACDYVYCDNFKEQVNQVSDYVKLAINGVEAEPPKQGSVSISE